MEELNCGLWTVNDACDGEGLFEPYKAFPYLAEEYDRFSYYLFFDKSGARVYYHQIREQVGLDDLVHVTSQYFVSRAWSLEEITTVVLGLMAADLPDEPGRYEEERGYLVNAVKALWVELGWK